MTFNEAQITELRTRFAAIQTVDPMGNAYAGMRRLLDALTQEDLKMLADANIKWLSLLALNRITKQ